MSHDGSNNADPLVPALDGGIATTAAPADVVAHGLNGALLRQARVVDHSDPDVSDPYALLGDLPADRRVPFVLVETTNKFQVQSAGNPAIGRQMIGLVEVPNLNFPEFEFEFGNEDSLKAEVDAWEAGMAVHIDSLERITVTEELDYTDSLLFILFERVVATLLVERGVLPNLDATLTPFLAVDSGRPVIGSSALASLQEQAAPDDPGYLLTDVVAVIRECIDNPSTAQQQALVALAEEVFQISAAEGNDSPGEYPAPYLTLRRFIEGQPLPSLDEEDTEASYRKATSLSNAELTAAGGAFPQILDKIAQRPLVVLELVVAEESFSGDCIELHHEGDGIDYQLVNASADPFSNFDTFELPVGTVLQVTGYTDLVSDCGPNPIQVVSILLANLTEEDTLDTDGNLLPDAWEYVFFGTIGQDPVADPDNDGDSKLHELMVGTDPNEGGGVIVPDDLPVPELKISLNGDEKLVIPFEYPVDLIDELEFCLLESEDLMDFEESEIPLEHQGGGQFEACIELNIEEQKFFYVVQVKKKPLSRRNPSLRDSFGRVSTGWPTMDERSLEIVDAYWSRDCGCERSELRPSETRVRAHGGSLVGNPGIWILVVGEHPFVSLPAELHSELKETAKGWTKTSVQDPATFKDVPIPADQVIGPAFIGYATSGVERDANVPVRELGEGDRKAYDCFQADCDPQEWDHGGSALGEVPAFGVFDEAGDLVSLSGYRVWDERIAHISIITSRSGRGRGAGSAAVAKAAEHAIECGLLPQYRTLISNAASMQVATRLGFEEYGFSVYLRLE